MSNNAGSIDIYLTPEFKKNLKKLAIWIYLTQSRLPSSVFWAEAQRRERFSGTHFLISYSTPIFLFRVLWAALK